MNLPSQCGELINVRIRLDDVKSSFLKSGGKNILSIPDMPDIIHQLEQEVKKKYPNTVSFIKIIESNTVISGELLSIVKSPTYLRHVKRDIEVKTIENVVNLIGMPQTYRLAQAAAIKNIPMKSPLFRNVIDHSSDIAMACAEIAGYVHGVDLDEAYMFGLFRDAGAIGMAVSFNENYDEHWDRMKAFPKSALEKEINHLGARHDYLGVMVARKWGFGENPGDAEIMLAIQEHHNFEEVRCFSNEKLRLLVAIGLMAEHMINSINGESYIASEADAVYQAAVDVLCLDDDVLGLIRKHLISNLVSGG